jgi:fatty-acyl-CoA synthase
MDVIDWLAKHATYSPDKTAIIEVSTGRTYSYRQFNDEANRFHQFLISLDVKPGDRVCALLPNGAELLFVLFGCTKLGAIFVPLNFKLAAPELIPIVADAQPVVLIYANEFRALAVAVVEQSRVRAIVSLEETREQIANLAPDNPSHIPCDMESPQMLLYTSGTTGNPKGVILSHRHILWNAINTSIRMLAATDTVLIHTPMFYTGGLNVYTLPAFYLGATVAIMKSFDAAETLRQIEQRHITALFAVPTQLIMMADSPLFPSANLTSLRYVISGGAPCPVPLIEQWIERGITLRQGFGLTEVGPNTFALDSQDARRKAGSIGFPGFSIEARIVDEGGRDVDGGNVGELIMRTPAMCSGYWNNPGQTNAAIRDGWFHTGDLARRDDEGYYYIVERKKDMFISGGENVYPAEIEHLLRTHPKIADVAVIGTPHPKWGEVGCAVVVLRPDESASEEELFGFCAGKIAKFKIPKRLIFIAELPRTVSGKVRKQDLKSLAGSH